MSNLIPLHFDRFDVRIIWRDGEPWWVLSDVCAALGIKNPTHASKRLDADERSTLNVGRQGEATIISEPGLMKVIIRSDDAIKPGTFAHRFVRWITHEVLPSIRQHGRYPPPAVDERALLEGYQAPDYTTPQGRFMEECARIAQEREAPSAFVVAKWFMSDGKAKAMMRGDGSIRDLVTNFQALQGLAAFEMDLRYVFTGVRGLGHTPHERQLLNSTRAATEDQRLLTEN